ncbi:MAG: Arginyl-tRNA--protein transferase 1 [Trichoglossum hirsutum]|nr:MAG: Arginyl-tRNA--protein transferase 1 [Trichoglossum hirsutum]
MQPPAAADANEQPVSIISPIDSLAFRPTRDQRRALNRWTRFVLGAEYVRRVAEIYPKSREEKTRGRNIFDLHESVHGCEYSRLKNPPEPAHKFEVTLESNNFTEEKYQIFENYQRLVHHEPPSKISRQGFTRFLCDSPLEHMAIRNGNQQEQKLGSYHQCYRLDGRLVAVGVLDLLPQCVSAVYFMYHEEVSSWNFGKLSALREAALAKEGGYRYYYMGRTEVLVGFYIHSCVKMRYKGEYHPQFILGRSCCSPQKPLQHLTYLDPETYAWDPLNEDARRRLDARKYVSLSRERRLGVDVRPTTEVGVLPHQRDALLEEAPMMGDGRKSPDNGGDGDDDGDDFTASMPGALTLAQVLSTIDLDRVRVNVGPHFCTTDDLEGWEESEADDRSSLKWFVAGFAAVVGKELMGEVVMGF